MDFLDGSPPAINNMANKNPYESGANIMLTPISKSLGALFLCACLAQPAAATLMLDPLSSAGYVTGGGLAATWSQVRDDYRFSQQPWLEPGQSAQAIGNFNWGTGIWGTVDIEHVQNLAPTDPALLGRVSTVSAVSFANQTYNELAGNGGYGTWGYDYSRPLAPIVAQTGVQTNYAASFGGYVYIADAGLYDFGLFADDGFTFALTGANGVLGVNRETLAGSSTGRDHYTLSGANGNSAISLGSGYYGIQIDYFNRLESGVIDLALWGPQDQDWRSISADWLFVDIPASTNVVSEPGMLALLAFGLIGVGSSQRRRQIRKA